MFVQNCFAASVVLELKSTVNNAVAGYQDESEKALESIVNRAELPLFDPNP